MTRDASPLPSLDALLRAPSAAVLLARFGRSATTDTLRRILAERREARIFHAPAEDLLDRAADVLAASFARSQKPVFNLTGTVLHTNLGRARLAPEALAALGDRTIHVVPFFMEDGYFTRIAVPKALAGGQNLRFYPPIGTHPGMVDLIRNRIAGHAPSDIVLVGHGSAKSPGRRYALHDHAEQLGARVAFLEEPPFLPDALADAAGPSVAVIGIFAGEGGHVRDDLPALIAAGRQRYDKEPIDLGSIGDAPGLSDLILDSVARS